MHNNQKNKKDNINNNNSKQLTLKNYDKFLLKPFLIDKTIKKSTLERLMEDFIEFYPIYNNDEEQKQKIIQFKSGSQKLIKKKIFKEYNLIKNFKSKFNEDNVTIRNNVRDNLDDKLDEELSQQSLPDYTDNNFITAQRKNDYNKEKDTNIPTHKEKYSIRRHNYFKNLYKNLYLEDSEDDEYHYNYSQLSYRQFDPTMIYIDDLGLFFEKEETYMIDGKAYLIDKNKYNMTDEEIQRRHKRHTRKMREKRNREIIQEYEERVERENNDNTQDSYDNNDNKNDNGKHTTIQTSHPTKEDTYLSKEDNNNDKFDNVAIRKIILQYANVENVHRISDTSEKELIYHKERDIADMQRDISYKVGTDHKNLQLQTSAPHTQLNSNEDTIAPIKVNSYQKKDGKIKRKITYKHKNINKDLTQNNNEHSNPHDNDNTDNILDDNAITNGKHNHFISKEMQNFQPTEEKRIKDPGKNFKDE